MNADVKNVYNDSSLKISKIIGRLILTLLPKMYLKKLPLRAL